MNERMNLPATKTKTKKTKKKILQIQTMNCICLLPKTNLRIQTMNESGARKSVFKFRPRMNLVLENLSSNAGHE